MLKNGHFFSTCSLRWLLLLLVGPGFVSAPSAQEAQGKVTGDSARVINGFYLSGGYSMVYAPDDTIGVSQDGSSADALLDYDLGFRATSLAAGYSFNSGFRAELEASYRRNELEVIEFSDNRGVLNTGASDSVDAFSGFANLYYEFQPRLAFQPYFGLGAGFTSVGYKGNFSVLDRFIRTESPLFDKRASAFAWQVMAGASIAFTPRTRLSAEYRYWQTADLEFSSDQTEIQSDYRTQHKLHMAGIQLQFFPGASKLQNASDRADDLPRSQAMLSGIENGSWYGAARFGVAAAEDSDVKDNSIDTNFDAFDIGPTGGLALGYQWQSKRGTALRAEIEASAFSNEADLVDFGFIIGEFRLRGDTRTRAVAVNLIAERSRRTGIYPYAGIGFGYAEVDYDVELTEARPDYPDLEFLNGKASSPTAQALLGVRVDVAKQLSVSLGYRYWWAPILKLNNPRNERIETEHSAHMVQIGLQWNPRAFRR